MTSITEAQFRDTMKAAISHRQVQYSTFYAFHFRWEDDNTSADKDERSFTELAKLMGFPKPDVHVIPKSAGLPGFDVVGKVQSILHKAALDQGNSVVMIHYSGHAGFNNLGELNFTSRGKKTMAAKGIFQNLETDSLLPFEAKVDVVVILDCCYSFLATRTGNPEHRLIDVLGAGDDRDPVALGARGALSFTSKLLIEVRNRAQNGDVWVEMASLIDKLRASSPRKTPTYSSKLGLGSVMLPLDSSAPSVASRPAPSGLKATFSIHVSKTFNNEELEAIAKWVTEKPKAKSASLKLELVKQTNSMVFIFESNLVAFYRIAGLPGVNLICENISTSYDHIIRPSPLPSTSPQHDLENVNPNIKKKY